MLHQCSANQYYLDFTSAATETKQTCNPTYIIRSSQTPWNDANTPNTQNQMKKNIWILNSLWFVGKKIKLVLSVNLAAYIAFGYIVFPKYNKNDVLTFMVSEH